MEKDVGATEMVEVKEISKRKKTGGREYWKISGIDVKIRAPWRGSKIYTVRIYNIHLSLYFSPYANFVRYNHCVFNHEKIMCLVQEESFG